MLVVSSWCRFADMILVFSTSVFDCFGKFELRLNEKSNRRFRFMTNKNGTCFVIITHANTRTLPSIREARRFLCHLYFVRTNERIVFGPTQIRVNIMFELSSWLKKKHDQSPWDMQPTCPHHFRRVFVNQLIRSVYAGRCIRLHSIVFGYSNGFIFRQ